MKMKIRIKEIGIRKAESGKKLRRTASKSVFGGLILDGGNDPKKSGGFGWVGPVGAG